MIDFSERREQFLPAGTGTVGLARLYRKAAHRRGQTRVDIGGHLVAVGFVQKRVSLRTGFKARGLFTQPRCIGCETFGKRGRLTCTAAVLSHYQCPCLRYASPGTVAIVLNRSRAPAAVACGNDSENERLRSMRASGLWRERGSVSLSPGAKHIRARDTLNMVSQTTFARAPSPRSRS